MSKLLEVKEFDLITDNIVFRDNVKYKYLNNKKDTIRFQIYLLVYKII